MSRLNEFMSQLNQSKRLRTLLKDGSEKDKLDYMVKEIDNIYNKEIPEIHSNVNLIQKEILKFVNKNSGPKNPQTLFIKRKMLEEVGSRLQTEKEKKKEE